MRGEARSSLIERTAQENPVFSQLVGAGAGEALELIGKGEDPLSKGISSGVEKAVQISSANFPQTTEAVLSALGGVSDTIDAVVTYTDDATGNVVSANWNSLDPTLRDQLKGTGKTVTVLVPFAKIKTIVEGAKIVEAGKVGQVVAFAVPADFPRHIHLGQQGKHIPGHNNFDSIRSVLTENPQELLDGIHRGEYQIIREVVRGNSTSRFVDFGKPIGEFKMEDGTLIGPTKYGQVVHGKNGAHIIPANPEQYR